MNLTESKKKFEPPSDMFMEAVTDAGSISINCELCGRTHFATCDDNVDFDEGELESLRAKAAENPDKYMEDATVSMISWGYIDNQQVVHGCPCNIARRYEDWIWQHRCLITSYMKNRIRSQKREAEWEENGMEGIVESASELLVEWLKRNGWKVEGNVVHNGSYWSRIENVDMTKVKVGTVIVDVHDPHSFPNVEKYLRECDEEAKEFMRKKEAVG